MPHCVRMLIAAVVCVTFALSSFADTPKTPAPSAKSMELLRGWEIQSSCEAKAAGEQVSQAGFATSGWHQTTIPNTVVGALVDDKTYPDPMVGTNLRHCRA